MTDGGDSARVTLKGCTCDLEARPGVLWAQLRAGRDHIDRMEAFVGGWIERVAYRENAMLIWTRGAPDLTGGPDKISGTL